MSEKPSASKRLMRKVSRTELGDRVGVTFQQIQKVERRVSPIGHSAAWKSPVPWISTSFVLRGSELRLAPTIIRRQQKNSSSLATVCSSMPPSFHQDAAVRKKIVKLVQATACMGQTDSEAAVVGGFVTLPLVAIEDNQIVPGVIASLSRCTASFSRLTSTRAGIRCRPNR